ncbi:hypothetical protein D9M68_861480 [compost metagenome]
MASSTIIPTSPTVWSADAWFTASLTSVLVASPTAVPAAATRAVSKTAVPVAASQPKKAEPILIPPNCSFSRATTVSRVAAFGSATTAGSAVTGTG